MDYSKKTRDELISLCKEKSIRGYSRKKKEELIGLISRSEVTNTIIDNSRSSLSSKLKVLSLFSGCGGLDYGFHNNEIFEVIKSFDSMQYAVETYNANFTTKSQQMDVNEIMKPTFDLGFSPDIIIGGPPCQDFSVAGEKTLGDRANLTETYIDIICKYRPLYFVMENVPTIRTIGKPVYDKIIQKLKDASYGITDTVIYMPDYGIPQERKRLVIIGKRDSNNGLFNSLISESKTPVKSIREYLEKTKIDIGLNGKEHIYRHPRNYSRRGVYSIDELYPTVRGCLRKIPPTYEFHKGDTTKIREDIISPDWNMIAKIQTFPLSFKFLNKNNALIIGNAVPPKFSLTLASIIATHHTTS
jgi:DNA (cytosine-5)-methyltransferase 1